MKKKRILCAILVCVMIVMQVASLGVVSLADSASPDGDFEITLFNGAIVKTDDFYNAIEIFNNYGTRLVLYADAVLDENCHISSSGVIDLNGHTISSGYMYFYNNDITVTDSSAGGGGAMLSAYMYTSGELTLDGIDLSGGVDIEDGAVIMKGVNSENFMFEFNTDAIRVSIEDTVFDELYISGEQSIRMNAVTVREKLVLDGGYLESFFGNSCTSVTDGDGQTVVFEQDAQVYEGVLKISHDNSKIDNSVWKHSNTGHFHLCECGYKSDFDKHTSTTEKCSVCNAVPYMGVTKRGVTEYFFDIWDVYEAIGEEGSVTVKLHGDVYEDDYLDIYGAVSVTLDLAGYELNCSSVYLYDDAELTVIDTSVEKDGRLSVRNHISLEDSSLFRLVDGGIDGSVNVYDSSLAELKGGSSGSIEMYASSEGMINIGGGVYESLYMYSGAQNTFIANAVITDSLVSYMTLLEDYLDHSCITVNTGAGPEYDPSVMGYSCEGNSLVITHNDAGVMQTVTGIGGYHGNLCSVCGFVKNIERCSGGDATCTAPANCQVCAEPYGKSVSHTIGADGKCSVCNTAASVTVTGDGRTLYFFDLGDAFKAADELSSAVITLGDDVSYYEDEINAHGNIVLDMAGYELILDELNVYGSLVLGNKEKGGSFACDGSNIDVYDNATLTIEGGYFGEDTVYIDTEGDGAQVFINGGRFDELDIYTIGKASLVVITDIEVNYLYCDIDRGNIVINGGYFDTSLAIYKDGDECLSEILDKPCITLYDSEGREISVEDYYNDGGELTVEHDAQHQGGGFVPAVGGHRVACTCGEPVGNEILPHQGGVATCESGRICSDCGARYGDNAPHSFVGGKCAACGGRENFRVDAEGFSQSYCSLEESLNAAAKHQNATVTLLQNHIEASDLELEIPASVTLDLAGKTLGAQFIMLDMTALTVKDSSESKSGALLGSVMEINEATAFKVESGNIYHWLYGNDNSSITVSGGICFGSIYSYDNGRIAISGGTIGDASLNSDPIKICVDDNAAVNISGGVFSIVEIDIDDNTVLDLSGGLFKGDALIIEYDDGARANVSGGAFENGIILELDEGVKQLTLADIVSGSGCTAIVDGNGNKVDMTAQKHESYIVVSNVCSYALKSDESGHWYECSVCADRKPVEAHADADGDKKCDLCSFALSEEGGLGAGAIVGIVLGGVAVAGIGGFAIFWFVIKKKSFADLVAVFKK